MATRVPAIKINDPVPGRTNKEGDMVKKIVGGLVLIFVILPMIASGIGSMIGLKPRDNAVQTVASQSLPAQPRSSEQKVVADAADEASDKSTPKAEQNLSAIYGNWRSEKDRDGCAQNFLIFSVGESGAYIFNSAMEQTHTPPNYWSTNAKYTVRNGVIFLQKENGSKTYLFAYRLLSSGRMQGLSIIKDDGTILDTSDFLAGKAPAIASVTTGSPVVEYVKCGAEAAAALAQMAQRTASADAAQTRLVADANQMISSNPLAKAEHDLSWTKDIQQKCHYLSKEDETNLILATVRGSDGKDHPFSTDFYLGLSSIVSDEVKNTTCSSGQTKLGFDRNWRWVLGVGDR